MAKLINETTSNTKIGFSGPMWLACNSCAFTTISTRTLNIFGQFLGNFFSSFVVWQEFVFWYLYLGSSGASRSGQISHCICVTCSPKKSFFLSQKYYFLRNSATHSPYNLFSILHKKIAPPRQLFENKQGLNPTHLPIATIRQVQEELPGGGNGNLSWDCLIAF